MALLNLKSRKIKIEEVQRAVTEGRITFSGQFKEKLKGVDPAQAWDIIKLALPDLDTLKARDLVRLLLADKVTILKEKLEDRNEINLAIECLGYLPARESVEILVGLLSHKNVSVQLDAAGALKKHTPRLVVPPLIKALEENTVLPARVGEVLLNMGFLGQEALLEAYPQGDFRVKGQILELLIQSNNPKCRLFLKDALKSEDKFLVSKAIDAVEHFKFYDLWPELVESFTSTSWQIKARALIVLEKLKVKEATEFVELLLKDDDKWVCQCAERCLRVLKNSF